MKFFYCPKCLSEHDADRGWCGLCGEKQIFLTLSDLLHSFLLRIRTLEDAAIRLGRKEQEGENANS